MAQVLPFLQSESLVATVNMAGSPQIPPPSYSMDALLNPKTSLDYHTSTALFSEFLASSIVESQPLTQNRSWYPSPPVAGTQTTKSKTFHETLWMLADFHLPILMDMKFLY